jgi:hypothetical protein
MKFKSRQPKPPTGLEMSATFMMPDNNSDDQSREAILRFLEIVTSASKELGVAWLRVNCCNIPECLEGALQAAFDKTNRRPHLDLVIDNGASDAS